MEDYKHVSYGMGWEINIKPEPEPICVYRPNWFARVFLRRKLRYLNLEDVAKRLGDAAGKVQEQLVRDMFESGR